MERKGPVEESCMHSNVRLGYSGELGMWDNGFYVTGFVGEKPVDFLIDSGSTSTLLSAHLYQSLNTIEPIPLGSVTKKLRDVNGNDLVIQGSAEISLRFKEDIYKVSALVCNITQDAILGQDFLIKYGSKIDYQKLQIAIGSETLNCWTGGNAAMVCRVQVKETTTIPPESQMIVTVNIPNACKLSETALVEPSIELMEKKGILLTPGIIDPNSNNQSVNVVNFSGHEIKLYPNTYLGCCSSLIPDPAECDLQRCARVESPDGEANFPEYLCDLLERSSVHLTAEETRQLEQLLFKYKDVFSENNQDIGRTERVVHRIETGNIPPIRTQPRRLPLGKKKIEQEEIKKMLDNGIIEPSKSAWSSPIVLVPKKDGSTRFCVDYRKLNEITIKDAYPLPRVDDCLDALANSKWFSSMDLNSGFWQIGMAEEHREKTAFSTSLGLFHFKVMPFGLCNSPSTLSRLLEDVLRGLQWEECLLYMDDIIVPGSTFAEALQRIEIIFERLRDANLKLKPSKCNLFQKSVKFLGHTVSEKGVHTDPDKTEVIRNWPIPKTAREIRSYLGLCSYYRRFVPGFAHTAKPLHKLCEKNSQFTWTDDCQQAFDSLKTALMTPPILAYPIPGKTFILDTDASDRATGAVLSQKHDDGEHVIAYLSKAMNKHEQSYCVTRKELLAVVNALKHFHSYLYGQEVLLRTDNSAVSWVQNLKNPTGQMARWLQEIGNYNLKVTHRPGKKHTNADAMSRNPCKVCVRQDPELDDQCDTVRVVTRGQTENNSNSGLRDVQFLLEGWNTAEIRQKQLEDPNIGSILVAIEDETRPTWKSVSDKSGELKTLWRQWDRLRMVSGILYRRWEDDDGVSFITQLIVPKSMQAQVLRYHHDIPSAGHLGAEKTLGRIKQGFYWPSMKETVSAYCHSCDQCAARKQSKRKNHAPLGSYHVGEPMERVALDILGPLPLTKNGNKYVLVMVDCFTKWTEAVALPDQEAKTVAKAFVDTIICHFGTPLQIHTDQGRNFESNLFKEMCDLFQIDKTRTTSYHPQSNGNVERFNRTLGDMLSTFCSKKQDQWDIFLPQVLMAYRSSVNSSTGQTPNAMMLGRELILPLRAIIREPESNTAELDEENYISTLKRKLQVIHELGREKLKQSAIYQKKHYDIKAKKKSYKEGQAVWLHDTTRKVGVCQKLSYRWKGPYVVIKKIDDLTYLVKRSKNSTAKIFHIDRLLPYNGRKTIKWYKPQ